jgi:hypothetical protein
MVSVAEAEPSNGGVSRTWFGPPLIDAEKPGLRSVPSGSPEMCSLTGEVKSSIEFSVTVVAVEPPRA